MLFYHSGCAEPGIVGIARVASGTRPDPTQFDPASPYFDPASKPDSPRWLLLDVQAPRKTRLLSLYELRATPGFEVPWEPEVTVVAFRCLPPDGQDANAFNARLLRRINDLSPRP